MNGVHLRVVGKEINILPGDGQVAMLPGEENRQTVRPSPRAARGAYFPQPAAGSSVDGEDRVVLRLIHHPVMVQRGGLSIGFAAGGENPGDSEIANITRVSTGSNRLWRCPAQLPLPCSQDAAGADASIESVTPACASSSCACTHPAPPTMHSATTIPTPTSRVKIRFITPSLFDSGDLASVLRW